MLHQQTLQLGDVPIIAVTVFTDRAEVQRRCTGLKLVPGLNRVLIQNVTHSIIDDSISVDGKGTGVTISGMQFHEERVDRNKVTSQCIEELRTKKEELTEKRDALEEANKLVEKQRNAIDDILDNVCDGATEQSLEMLYGFHKRKGTELLEESRAQRKVIVGYAKQIETVTKELDELVRKGRDKRSITVDLESKGGVSGQHQEKGVELILTYQVHQASWSPSYDIRAEMEQQESSGQQQMKGFKIHYYGIISQNSGENWENVRLTLSTAQPSCGKLPKLGTTFAKFVRPPAVYRAAVAYHPMPMMGTVTAFGAPCGTLVGGSAYASIREGSADKRSVSVEDMDEEDTAEEDTIEEMKAFSVQQTEAKEDHPLATTFSIGQPMTIGDGDVEHKVTIAVLDQLLPGCVLHYDCVPCKNTNVFLQATVLNSSAANYPLLAGPASIYLNGCFNQKVRINAVAVGDSFEVPLGVCPAIKVTYKPTNKLKRETTSVLLTKSSILGNEQKIVVKNSNAKQQFLLTVVEPVPKTTDEKIKIRVVAPELKQQVAANTGGGTKSSTSRSSIGTAVSTEGLLKGAPAVRAAPTPGARLNADNNLEWTVLLEGGQEKVLTVKWEAEYPADKKLEFQEKREK